MNDGNSFQNKIFFSQIKEYKFFDHNLTMKLPHFVYYKPTFTTNRNILLKTENKKLSSFFRRALFLLSIVQHLWCNARQQLSAKNVQTKREITTIYALPASRHESECSRSKGGRGLKGSYSASFNSILHLSSYSSTIFLCLIQFGKLVCQFDNCIYNCTLFSAVVCMSLRFISQSCLSIL